MGRQQGQQKLGQRLLELLSGLVLAVALSAGSLHAATAQQKAQSSQARKTVPKAVSGAKAVHKPVQPVSLRHGGKQKRVVRRTAAPMPPEVFNPDHLDVQSTAAMVVNLGNGEVIYDKNISAVAPIASITKLMTAMVVLDAKLPLDEIITVTEEDFDYLKYTGSRLAVGMTLTRDEMLRLALMSSENRAAAALGRAYPGGMPAFVKEMNLKALSLEMMHTSFVDSTGLSSSNVSTASDLTRMVKAAYQYPLIRQYSTGNGYAVYANNGRPMQFGNSNSLVVSPDWQVNLQKTGYIREAGRCVVMHTTIANSPIVIVLLDSWGRMSRVGDANRIKKWIEYHAGRTVG
jgi:D-alanyl-D-alanine endopeptidase (penicillin-binding protein 7)